MTFGVTQLEGELPGVRAWVLVSALPLPGCEPRARPLCSVFPFGRAERLDPVASGALSNWDILKKQPRRSRIRDPPGPLCCARVPCCRWALSRALPAAGQPQIRFLSGSWGSVSLEVYVGRKSEAEIEVPHGGF